MCAIDHDLEVIEEILDLVNLLIFRSPKDNVHPGLWHFFEFLCYTTNLKLNLPEPSTTQNKYLGFLSHNRQNFQEFSSNIIRCFRNYIYIGKNTLLTKTDEQGNAYIDLLLGSIAECKNYISDVLEDCILVETSMLEAVLVFEYKDNLQLIQSKNLLTNCMAQTFNLVSESKNTELYQSAKIHNLGLLCASFFNETMQTFNTSADFLNNWILKHMSSLTYRVRKASMLGLLNLLRNYKSVPQVSSQLSFFVSILLKEMVVLKLQKRHEEDADYDLDGLSDLENTVDLSKMTIQDFLQEQSLTQIENRISMTDGNYMMETEILLNYDWDFILESLQKLDMKQIAKETFALVEQENPGLMTNCLAQFNKDIATDIQAILSG